MSADKVRRLRAELLASIAELAALEGWPAGRCTATMSRAANEPLAGLLDNLTHFQGEGERAPRRGRSARSVGGALLAARGF